MPNIRNPDLERYLRVFHDTNFETASDVLPKDLLMWRQSSGWK